MQRDMSALSPTLSHLSAEDEHRLARRWQTHQDQRALARIIEAHLGLVSRIAREFRYAGPSFEDLLQEGRLGLTIAARRFDPDAGTRLVTYATYWIRACLMESVVRNHGPVRIGTTRAQRRIYFGLGRARRRLERQGLTATVDLVAAELGVERAELDAMMPRLQGRDPSLDIPQTEDASAVVLSDPGQDPEHTVAQRQVDELHRRRLAAALARLQPREAEIIRARHLCESPVTLEEIGAQMGVSRERVRQLEQRAMSQLRALCA